MSTRLTRTDRAEGDLLAFWAHIALDNPAAADAALDKLEEASRYLAAFPSLGPEREDLGTGVRYFPLSGYPIVYRQIAGGVDIIRYLHGSPAILNALAEADPADPRA